MRHDDIWRAIDALAAEHGLSASGLARRAGLDATAFNPSKRIGGDGRARWPSTESMEPVFRDGDIVVVSPAAPVRRGDRVVVRTAKGEVMAKELKRQSAKRIDLRSLNPAHPDRGFDLPEIAWMHRIIWAS